jgi:hypothetical protein
MPNTTAIALLTIRTWCEERSQRPFRAEISVADDVASGFRSTSHFIDAYEVLEAVRDFLYLVVCPPMTSPSRSGHSSVTADVQDHLRPSEIATLYSRKEIE